MKPYTKDMLLSSMREAVAVFDKPINPCFCAGWERCRCKENALVQQINHAINLLEDAINPNASRALEHELSRLARETSDETLDN